MLVSKRSFYDSIELTKSSKIFSCFFFNLKIKMLYNSLCIKIGVFGDAPFLWQRISRRWLLLSGCSFHGSINPIRTSKRFHSFLVKINCAKVKTVFISPVKFGFLHLHPYAVSPFNSSPKFNFWIGSVNK